MAPRKGVLKVVPFAICLAVVMYTLLISQGVAFFGWLEKYGVVNEAEWLLDTTKEYVLHGDSTKGLKEHTFNVQEREVKLGNSYQKLVLINGKYPGPLIDAHEGDTVRVTLVNHGLKPTSIHFHGVTQHNTNYMDGVTGVTQCGILPGQNFTYEFRADRPGTYWYRGSMNIDSEQSTQGLLGPLIVRDNGLRPVDIEQELVLFLTDSYEDSIENLAASYMEPWIGGTIPEAKIFMAQGQIDPIITFSKSGVYKVRLINAASDTAFRLSLNNSRPQLVELDSTPLEAREVEAMEIFPGQRATLRFNFKDDIDQKKSLSLTTAMANKTKPIGRGEKAGTLLAYGSSPVGRVFPHKIDHEEKISFPEISFSELYPDTPPTPAETVYLEAGTLRDKDGCAQSCFNSTPYMTNDNWSPVLAQMLRSSSPRPRHTHKNTATISTRTQGLQFNEGTVVDLVIRNTDNRGYSFHLHGHRFWVMERGDGAFETGIKSLSPVRRDTVWIPRGNWARMRFVANNPGVWQLHCHNLWSGMLGMSTVIAVNSPRTKLVPPQKWYELCHYSNLGDSGI